MPTESLLGHVALRFPSQENLATESLVYIVGRSQAAKRGLLSFFHHQLGLNFPATMVFRPQDSGSDGSIPDVVGYTQDGKSVVVIEAKFWAGLTDNQPVSYLRRLPLREPAVLLFVVPTLRLTILWDEIIRRCTAANLDLGTEQENLSGPELRLRKVGDHHFLALVSWRALLMHIAHGLDTEGDLAARSDLQQLQGLCDRMDEEAFLPLRSEELTSATAARLLQFVHLVNDVVGSAVKEELVSYTQEARTSWSNATYWYPFKMHGFCCYLQVNFQHWARLRSTPIWLSILDAEWKVTQTVKDALVSLEHEEPHGVIYVDEKPVVPLILPLGAERPTVLQALLGQLRKVADLLGQFSTAPGSGIAADRR